MKQILFVLLFAVVLSYSDTLFKEGASIALYPPSGASIISPDGNYFVYNTRDMDFELMAMGDAVPLLNSRFIAWTSPYPEYKKPDFRCFYFSPDSRFLITDNYVFDDSLPIPVNWVEIWDIAHRRIERQFSFREEKNVGGCRLGYDLESILKTYFNRSPYKNYVPNARIVFTPNGNRIFFMYPALHVFSFPDFEEKTGDFATTGITKDVYDRIKFSKISAPAFFNNSNKTALSLNGNTFIFNDLLSSSQDYYKIQGEASHIEISSDNKMVLVDNKLFSTDFANVLNTLPSTSYISPDGNRIASGRDLFAAEPNFGKLTPFYLGDGTYYPSSTREFLFIFAPHQRSFFIHSFSTGELLQTIKIGADEYLLRNTDDGNKLLFKNRFTGKVRIFEKVKS